MSMATSPATPLFESSNMGTLFTCGFLLPTDEYNTTFTNFPGSNCTPRWNSHGDFYTTISLYDQGEKLAEYAVKHCNENGYLQADMDDLFHLTQKNLEGILVMENIHTKGIPLDMYMFHTHRKSGQYVSYPIATFMGDRIYTMGDLVQLDNTLFWPGIVSNQHSESLIKVLNPYKSTMSYQLSVYLTSGERRQSQVLKTKALSHSVHRIEEIFPEIKDSKINDGRISLCIAGQFRLVCYFMIRNRATNTYSTIDHLHNYCLF